ncbi:hypothetical protein TWF696_004111 [Orbilia brochopaga]|uniref:Uncharacterized protein n=1 Tax=Orbilia brochopaga TaxID=3140254 RepID=A0AAV9V7I4_9PEZI
MVSTRKRAKDVVMLNDAGQEVPQPSGRSVETRVAVAEREAGDSHKPISSPAKPQIDTPRKRGRPRKTSTAERGKPVESVAPVKPSTGNQKKPRGRQPKTRQHKPDTKQPKTTLRTATKTIEVPEPEPAINKRGAEELERSKEAIVVNEGEQPERDNRSASATVAPSSHVADNGMRVNKERPSKPGKGTRPRNQVQDQDPDYAPSISTAEDDTGNITNVDEQDLRENMTYADFLVKFVERAGRYETRLKSVYANNEAERDSIERRIRALENIIQDDAKELDTHGTYSEVYRHHRLLRDEAQPLPTVHPGDPYKGPLTIDFNPDDQRIHALFKNDEERRKAISVYTEAIGYIESSKKAADSLFKAAERIFLDAKGYQSKLEHNRDFLKRLIEHEETAKVSYIRKRMEDRDSLRLQRFPDGVKREQMRRIYHAQRDAYCTNAGTETEVRTPQKKRRLSVSVSPTAGRKKPRYGDKIDADANRCIVISDDESDGNEHVPDSVEVPVTPTQRIRLPGFGDHTPGRTRRIDETAGANGDGGLAGTQNGKRMSRPWTNADNDELDHAMRDCTQVPGRWLDIKEKYGQPGQSLEHWSAEELHARAKEIWQQVEPYRNELPPWWDDVQTW